MTGSTYLITGASRGIGLEFVRQILGANDGSRIIAAARNPAAADKLQALATANPGRVEFLTLNVSDVASVKAAAEEAEKLSFAAEGVDVLFNNAGIAEGGFNDALDPLALETLTANVQTNLIGPVATTLAFLPLLRKGRGKKIVTTSTMVGSFGGPLGALPMGATYGASKAGINFWSLKLALALKPEGFTVVNFHPGYVRTELTAGLPGEQIEVEESVEKSLAVVQSKGPDDTGKFFNYTGEALPW